MIIATPIRQALLGTAVLSLSLAGLGAGTAGAAPKAPARVDVARGSAMPSGATCASRATHNWAGYVRHAAHTTQASAQWRVPRITSTRTEGDAATWVGLDGVDNRYLVQLGVGQAIEKGHVFTYAWWESLSPTSNPPEQLMPLDVRPGDVVSASVSVVRHRATLTLRNLTTRKSATTQVGYAGPGSTAEWVQEDAQVGTRISPAIAWTPVSFSHVVVNSRRARLAASQAVDIVDTHKVRETRTSNPSRPGDSFSVTRLAAGHWQ